MKKIFKKHKWLWREKQFLFSVFIGLLLFTAGITITYYANAYTSSHVSNSVTDILLDNLPVVNADFIFDKGPFIFFAILILIFLYEPPSIPFALKNVALFFIVRAIAMTLTHIAPPIDRFQMDHSDLMYKISSGGDLFFSGHTGLPFLLALIYWDNKFLKYFLLIFTIIGGVGAILGHVHYSIDVFSAFFIAFGIFHISKKIFFKDYQLYINNQNLPQQTAIK